MRKDFAPGRHMRKEGNKRREGVIHIERDGYRKREREPETQGDGKGKRRRELRESRVSYVQKGHSTTVVSLVRP